MNWIRQLSEVNRQNVPLVGGKAASLGEMIQAGIKVPPGFVVTTEAFRVGMSKELEKEVMKAFDGLGPSRVAVRSSAVAEDSSTASWAGQLDTYLNVTREGLIEAIQKCWESINSEHAQSYADENKVRKDQCAVAVVLQTMIDSEIAGVMFTANPVSNDRQQLMIEAVYGLGELLVQGGVTPESLVLDKKSSKVIESSLHRQPKMLVYKDGKNQEVLVPKPGQPILSDKQIQELLKAANAIEKHYKFPQDIEWAMSADKLYIVQSRPITTLSDNTKDQVFTFEKTFTREESLIIVEVLYEEFSNWLSNLTTAFIPPMFFRSSQGLLESWFCKEATEALVNHVYEENIKNTEYLKENIRSYKDLIIKLGKFEQNGHAPSLNDLKQYLALFREAIIPLHIIFFTPLRNDTPKKLRDMAVKVRGEDALFDNSDLYVRDSLAYLYPEFSGFEALIGLKDLLKPDLQQLKKRENNFFWAGGKYLSMDLRKFEDMHSDYKLIIDEIDTKQRIIKGLVAYNGVATGEVQIIARKKDISNFNKGNILVAPMTTPHYLPAMKMAAAFITDEGGVTCHAAIVAREMKKPCIIGTKIATQVLKDGDLVEVDADTGIITLLSNQDEYDLGKPEDLFYWGPSRAKPLYMDDFMMAAEGAFVQMHQDPVMPNPPKTLVLFHDDKMVWMQTKRFENFSKKAFLEYQKQDRLDKDKKDWDKAVKALDVFAVTTLKDVSKLEQFRELTVNAWKQTIFAEFSLYGASAVITEQLKRFTEKERQVIWGAFTLPHQLLFMQQIDAELATGDPQELAKKYPWLQDGYQGVSDNIEEYFVSRQEIVKGNTTQPVEKASNREKVAKQFKLKKAEIGTLNLARQLAYFMDQRKAWMMRTRRYIAVVAKAVAAENGASLSKLEYTRLQYLNAKPVPFYGWLYTKGRVKDIPVGIQEELWERYVEFQASSTVLKGLIASSGGRHFINGEVRVVKRPTDAVADDRVLVVTATSPSYVPLMRNARALVTDHGGMMSHAAIVARELGLPCIIGTKHATKILKSGDKVVLDLVKGEVNL